MEEYNNEQIIEGINVSASVTIIPPSQVIPDGYEFSNSNIIPSEIISGSFSPEDPNSSIELFIYDLNNQIVSSNYNYTDWKITENKEVPNVNTTYVNDQGLIVQQTSSAFLTTDTIEVNPVEDSFNVGVDNGEVYTLYNFITNELGSSNETPFYISEISGDRTEIRLKSNVISVEDIASGYNTLKAKLDSTEYFDEFYINFFNNIYAVGINIMLDGDSVLIKTFEPLSSEFNVEDQVYIVTKQSETIAYQVNFYEDFSELLDTATYIKGPNVNISIQDLVNNSTPLQSYNDLINTASSQSLDAVLNILNKTGVAITPNYSYDTFDEFINFSSAKQRILNFYEKVSQIESYQNDINVLNSTVNPNLTEVSQSLASLVTNISNIVSNFDGYENYLYYDSSSYSYPKSGNTYPYSLHSTGSTEVLQWLGSDVEIDQYYGGYLLSASLYDDDNQNWLYYTIPDFIKENSDNDNYILFTNMVGQHFDEIWLYTKALSERYNTTNSPDRGLPLELAKDAVKHLGFEAFGNNYNNQDNFIGLTGEDNGSYVPPTGEELINNYIAVNGGRILNYWNFGYSWEEYVESINDPGWPYAIDKVSKEIYKRLYHNMAYLTKKKGTISGLRQLINIWGIPNTILRINEFGGKNRDNSNDYDLWYNRYNYAYNPIGLGFNASSSIRVPWMPLQRNFIADGEYIVPDGIALRFRTSGHPTSTNGGSYYSQSLMVKKSNGVDDDEFDWGVALFYEDQPTGTYSGSANSDYYDYGKLRFYISGSVGDGGVHMSDDIELPFFNGDWWSILIQRDTHISASDPFQPAIYTLYAGNKHDNGWDGNSIGWTGSVTMSSEFSLSLNQSWNNFGTTQYDGVYVGGHISGSVIDTAILNEGGKIFSGSLQEFRYYSNNISEEVFHDFVMNPESIEGNNVTGSESSFDIVNFRAPLGNELEHIFTASVSQSDSYSEYIPSFHPAISGSAPTVITQSFINPSDSSLTSSYEFIYFNTSSYAVYSVQNVEKYFLDQPSIGIRNRVSNKVQVDDGEDYGTTLSRYRSIQQDYLISRSYTEDTNRLEVGFSPQDEVNDDIIASFGYGVISNTLADPRFYYEGDETYYPNLRRTAEDYFKKYKDNNVWDYIRLIKYFDNSIFKAIKAYVPARTSVSTGIIIKQHMLERNRRVPVRLTPDTTIAYTVEGGNNTPLSLRNLELSSSLQVEYFTGSAGGSTPDLNGNISGSGPGFNQVAITQSWSASHATPEGLIEYIDETQNEFYNGEYSGSAVEVTNGILLDNPFSPSQVLDTSYNIEVTASVGQWTPDNGGMALTTFPSYSLDVDVTTVSAMGGYTMSQLRTLVQTQGIASKAFLVVQGPVQSDGLNSYYTIRGLAIPLESEYYNGTNTSTLPESLFNLNLGFDGINIIPTINPNDIPLPPSSQYPFTYPSNNLGPYFKLELNSDTNTAGFVNIDGLDSGTIVSPALGDREGIVRDGNAGLFGAMYYALYYWSNPTVANQRSIVIPDGSSFTDGTGKLYLSNFDFNYNNDIGAGSTEFGEGFYNSKTTTPPTTGTGSLFLQGTTYTGSFGDTGNYTPYALVINDKTYNTEGVTIDNQNTLANNPTFNIKVIESGSGIPATIDEYGLYGGLFSQENTSYNTFNIAVNDPSLSSFGFEYNPITSRGLSGSYDGAFDGLYTLDRFQPRQYINFFPSLPVYSNFYNTPYNTLLNNATSSITNTHVQVIEYNNGPIPSNIDAITSGIAVKADIPDSFYTQKSIITPRYLGSKLQSNTYNQITSTVNDSKPGTMRSTNTPISTVWKAPIYFAHFTSGKENYDLWDSYTYNIDALIQVPLEDITGDNAPDLPTLIKVDGDGSNLTNVRSTFEVDRYAAVTYNVGAGSSPTIPNNVGTFEIYQGSLEYNTILTSEPEKNIYVETGSFVTSSQLQVTASSPIPTYDLEGSIVNAHLGVSSVNVPNNGEEYWMSTGSGYLELNGGAFSYLLNISDTTGNVVYYGDSLTLIHSWNRWVKDQIYNINNDKDYPGLPSGSFVDPNDKSNYFIFNHSASLTENYQDYNEPFLIDAGDEIRVTYDISNQSSSSSLFVTQIFTATNDGNRFSEGAGTVSDIRYVDGGPQDSFIYRIYNRVKVTPDPSTLENLIPEGKIYNFTVRKRVNADNKVIVYQTPPSGSQGVNTSLPSGYLIPNDLTPVQKKNVQSLITQLNAKNTFDV